MKGYLKIKSGKPLAIFEKMLYNSLYVDGRIFSVVAKREVAVGVSNR